MKKLKTYYSQFNNYIKIVCNKLRNVYLTTLSIAEVR